MLTNSILKRENDLFNELVNSLSRPVSLLHTGKGLKSTDDFNNWTHAIANENSLDIYAEVPGFSKEDISITVKEKLLRIEGKRKGVNQFVTEKTLKLNYELSKPYDVKGITASVENGILHVSVPTIKPVEPEEVTIKIK